MEPLGTLLRQARAAKNLSLEDVSKATKLSVTVLNALEGEEFFKLPSETYARAFVRTYSNYLGVAPQAMEQYEKIRTPAAPIVLVWNPQPDPPKPKREIPWKINIEKRWIFVAAGVAAIVVVGWGLASLNRLGAVTKIEIPQHQMSIVCPAPNQVEGNSAAQPRPVPAANACAELAEGSAVQKVSKQAAKEASIPAPAKTEVRQVVAQEDLCLEIVANDKVWLRVKADNLLLYEGLLTKDDRESWKAKREFLVRVGSAGCLQISLNGRPLGKLGRKGEVKTVVINKDGIVKIR